MIQVRADGKLYGNYYSYYEAVRVKSSLLAQGEHAELTMLGEDKEQKPLLGIKGAKKLAKTDKELLSDWLEMAKNVKDCGHNSKRYYRRKTDEIKG